MENIIKFISRLFAKTPYAKYLVVGNEKEDKKEDGKGVKKELKVSMTSYNTSITTTYNSSITSGSLSLSDTISHEPSSHVGNNITLDNKRLLLHVRDIKDDLDRLLTTENQDITENARNTKELRFKTLLLSCMENTAQQLLFISDMHSKEPPNEPPLKIFMSKMSEISSVATDKSVFSSVRTSISTIDDTTITESINELYNTDYNKEEFKQKYELPLCSILLSMYDELENQGDDIAYNFINLALSNNNTEIVKSLLTDEKTPPIIKDEIHFLKTKPDFNGVTPLHVVCGLITDLDTSNIPIGSDVLDNTSIISMNDISFIIETIVKESPHSLILQDNDGITPLHLISKKISSYREPTTAESGKPISMMKQVLEKIKDANEGVKKAYNNMKDKILGIVDRYGNTPVHNLFMGIIPANIENTSHIKSFIQSISMNSDERKDSLIGQMLQTPNMKGKTPLSYIDAALFTNLFDIEVVDEKYKAKDMPPIVIENSTLDSRSINSINSILLEFTDSNSIDTSYRSLLSEILNIESIHIENMTAEKSENIDAVTVIRHIAEIFATVPENPSDYYNFREHISYFLNINRDSKVVRMIKQYLYDNCAYELVFEREENNRLYGYIDLKESDFLIHMNDNRSLISVKEYGDNYKTDQELDDYIERIRSFINTDKYDFSIKYEKSEDKGKYNISANI